MPSLLTLMASVPRIIPEDNSLMKNIDRQWHRLPLTLVSLNEDLKYSDSLVSFFSY